MEIEIKIYFLNSVNCEYYFLIFSLDIKTILLCVSELLYSCSNSVSKCVDVGHTQIPHYSIHNLCMALLSSMTVVTSPLDILYK